MFVEKIEISNFRNFEDLQVEINPGVNIFYGDNAQGKTNFLEAVYVCAAGRSWRTSLDREIIRFTCHESHLQTRVCNGNVTDRIDIHLKRDEKKNIAVNRLPVRKLGDLFGVLLIVVFSPDDLSLVKSGPAERRKFMDVELCQLRKVYYYELKQYYHVLRQRNNLLKSLQKNMSGRDTLFVWNQQLVTHGVAIMAKREEFIKKINEYAGDIHYQVSSAREKLSVLYKPNVGVNDFGDKLERGIERDIQTGTTGCGIHKDDMVFMINGNDTRIYGSQGQQRTACLCVKLAEIEIIKEEKGVFPVLLLDDVLSELDENRQKYLLGAIRDIQTFITATGVEDIIKKISVDYSIYRVKNGVITFENI